MAAGLPGPSGALLSHVYVIIHEVVETGRRQLQEGLRGTRPQPGCVPLRNPTVFNLISLLPK